ncbi:MAG: glycoside hydrolase family 20 zincin-like fold domain-containing protein [Candidatus Hodarchaeota archaeon]
MIRIAFEKLDFDEASDFDRLKQLSPVPHHVSEGSGTVIVGKDVQVVVQGREEFHDEFLEKLGGIDVDYLVEPEWDLKRFSKKIEEIWTLRMGELQNKSIIAEENFKVVDEDWNVDIPVDKIPLEKSREAYRLTVAKEGIEIAAWSMHGAYYGLITLTQMLQTNPEGSLSCPAVVIHDYPQYFVRGLVDDISRGQRPTVDNFKKFIRFLSRGKQNALVLYIEDIVHFKSHPLIGKDRGALMPADIREIQDYAREWFVTIIPGVEMLGHMENMLLIPEYRKYGEFPGAQSLDTTNPETKKLVKELLADVIPLFDAPVFAPICDESSDFGQGKVAGRVKEVGYGKALAEWYLFLIEEIRALGKPIVFFAHDIIIKFKEALKEVQSVNAMIYCWIYANKKKYPAMTKLTNLGLVVAGGPAVFDWSRHYPYFEYAEGNMIGMGKDVLARGSIGLVTTKWGDFANENFRDNILYGIQVNAQAAWSPFKSNVPQIREAFASLFFGTRDPRVWKCMDTLARQNKDLPGWPNGMMNRYWLDPFVREIKSKEHDLAKRFLQEGIEVLATIKELRDEAVIKLNKDNLDYIEFAARMARHYGAKILISEAAYRDLPELAKFAREKIAYKGNPVRGGLKWLKMDIEEQLPDYQELWRKLAVEQGLENPTQRFKVLRWHYEQAILALESGKKVRAHQLPSEWIWRSGLRLSIDWGNKEWYYFVKPFTVSKKVKKATLQCIAGNHAKIAFNGENVGEVLSRFSIGLMPFVKAVQLFDVTALVKEGSNVICIDGINWGGGIGGLNVILHVVYKDGSVEDVMTDKTWKYTSKKPEGWPLTELPGNLEMKPVKSLGKPPMAWHGPITEPVWDCGWKSSISFVFGARNFFETAIPMRVGRTPYKLLFWVFSLVIPLVAPELAGYRKQH